MDWSESFDLYEAAGFGKIGDAKPETVDIKPPAFGWREWWAYLTNVAALAPIRKDKPMTGVPEGVLRLGGTFVLDGDDVNYAHAEELPGTSPRWRRMRRRVSPRAREEPPSRRSRQTPPLLALARRARRAIPTRPQNHET